MAKKLIKFVYNNIQFKNQREIAWMVMFDLFGWNWKKENENIYLIGDDVIYEVVVGENFRWNGDDLRSDEPVKVKSNTILLCYPKLEFKNHTIGWLHNSGQLTPICAMRTDDDKIALSTSNNVSQNLLSKAKMRGASYFTLRAAWQYAQEFNFNLLKRTTNKMAIKLGIRNILID